MTVWKKRAGKAVVLFSGGQDSTTCLAWALANFEQVEAITILYGQRHAIEVSAAGKIAALARVKHRIVDLSELGLLIPSALTTDTDAQLTLTGGLADREAPNGLPPSFVPGRNAIMLAVAVAHAATVGAHDVVTGVCQTDYSGYPDCREVFVHAMEVAMTLALPTGVQPIRILAPLMYLSKAETVRLARELPGAWDLLAESVTCYEGKRPACGACPSCVLRAKGFAEAGFEDPAARVGL